MREENGQAEEREWLVTERDNVLRQIRSLLDNLLVEPDDFERLQEIYGLMIRYSKFQTALYPSYAAHFNERARDYGRIF